MIFQFDTIPTHKRLLVRARVRGECSTDNTISMTLSGTTPLTVPADLTAGQQEVIEGAVDHTTATFTLTISFGTQGEVCHKILQDISVFYEACSSFCGSNICSAIQPYYKKSSLYECIDDCFLVSEFANTLINECVVTCPTGSYENVNVCTTFAFCAAECGSCTTKNDPAQCTTCPVSTFSSLTYATHTA